MKSREAIFRLGSTRWRVARRKIALLPILCQKPEFAFGAGFCTSESGTIRFSRQILPSIHSDKGSPQQHVHRTPQPHRQGCRLHRSRMHPPFSVSAGPCSTRTIRGAETDGNRSIRGLLLRCLSDSPTSIPGETPGSDKPLHIRPPLASLLRFPTSPSKIVPYRRP
jgi:hypothetical protein